MNQPNPLEEISRPTGEQFRLWADTTRLSDTQLGQLAGVSIDIGVGSAGAREGKGRRFTQCTTVQRWKRGKIRCPKSVWQLLRTKVYLLHAKRATFEELVRIPLDQIVKTMLSPPL